MQIIQETSNLVRLTRFGMFNCFLVKEDHTFTLVDTNFPGSESEILKAAGSLGCPISRIALTHTHFDHAGSLDALTAALPEVEVSVSAREARLLRGDFSLDAGEHGKPLRGFKRAQSRVHGLLGDGDQVGSLRVVASPGHSPGHVAFVDSRDNTLLAGDSYMTQRGVIAAGVYSFFFPLPAWFSWNCALAAESAAKLAALKPSRLAVGHGPTIVSPVAKMEETVRIALQQYSQKNNSSGAKAHSS
jgi:glyoxylase-like metal-dependent hydrolase (beta-lactamase superfamily II)